MLLPLLILLNSGIFVISVPPKLLIVAYDGLRWDFLSPILMPKMWKIAKNGVFARQGIKNQVMTVTAPTFFTIATGLFEESSGITGNRMFDPKEKGIARFFDYCTTSKTSIYALFFYSFTTSKTSIYMYSFILLLPRKQAYMLYSFILLLPRKQAYMLILLFFYYLENKHTMLILLFFYYLENKHICLFFY